MSSNKTTVNTSKLNSENISDINTNALIDINQTSYYIQDDWFETVRKYFNIDSDDTESISMLKAGLFGFNLEILSNEIKNNVYHRNIIYDEHFLNTASFPESIYNFAKMFNYDIDFANPSHCRINFAIARDDLINNKFREEVETETGGVINKRITYKLVINNDYTFLLGDFQFRLPYPIIINFKETSDKTDFSITAHYDTSNSSFPYLTLSTDYIKMWSTYDSEQGKRMVYLGLDLYQLSYKEQTFEIISEDISDNLFYNVNFTDQIAYFEVFYIYNGETIKLNTYFNNTFQPDDDENFCYYSVIDDDVLQLSFSAVSGSFRPALNSQLLVKVYTTKGSAGNFSYIGSKISVNFNNNGEFDKVPVSIIPITECSGGKDDPTYTEVKNGIIDKFAVRNNLIIDNDLDVHFKNVNNNETVYNSSIQWIKKRNDILKRLYTAYLTIRDKDKKIIPTNTAPRLYVSWNYLNNNSNKMCIKENTKVIYDFDRDIFVIDGDLLTDGYETDTNLSKALDTDENNKYEVSYKGDIITENCNLNIFDNSKIGTDGYTGIKYSSNEYLEEYASNYNYGYLYDSDNNILSDIINNSFPKKDYFNSDYKTNPDLTSQLPKFKYLDVYDDFIFTKQASLYDEYINNDILNEKLNDIYGTKYKYVSIDENNISSKFSLKMDIISKEIKDNYLLVQSEYLSFTKGETYGFILDYSNCINVKEIRMFLNRQEYFNINNTFDKNGNLKSTLDANAALAIIPVEMFLQSIYDTIEIYVTDINNNTYIYECYITDFNRNNYISIKTGFNKSGYYVNCGAEGNSIKIKYNGKELFSNSNNSNCNFILSYDDIKSKPISGYENKLTINAYNKKDNNSLDIKKYISWISKYTDYYKDIYTATPFFDENPIIENDEENKKIKISWKRVVVAQDENNFIDVTSGLVLSSAELMKVQTNQSEFENIKFDNLTNKGFEISYDTLDKALRYGTTKFNFTIKLRNPSGVSLNRYVSIQFYITRNKDDIQSEEIKMNFIKEIWFANTENYFYSTFENINNESGYHITSGKAGKYIKIYLNDELQTQNIDNSEIDYLVSLEEIKNSSSILNKIRIEYKDYYDKTYKQTIYLSNINSYFNLKFTDNNEEENGLNFKVGPSAKSLTISINETNIGPEYREGEAYNYTLPYSDIKKYANNPYALIRIEYKTFYGKTFIENIYIRNKINSSGETLSDKTLSYRFPFLLSIQHNPVLMGNYFNTFVNEDIAMKFKYINPHIDDNFSLKYLKISKDNINSTKYTISVSLNSTFNVIDEDNIKVRLIICDENNNPYGYINLKSLDTISSNGMANQISSFQFEGYLDINQDQPIVDNKLILSRLFKCKTKNGKEEIIINKDIGSNINLQLGILLKSNESNYKFGNFSEMSDLNNSFTTAVVYETETVNEIFQNMYNYMESDILTPLELKEEIGENNYKLKFGSSSKIFAIKQVPLIESEYFENSPNNFFDIWNIYLDIVKESIDYLENNTSVDIKLVNSYGNSKYYYYSYKYDNDDNIAYNYINNVQLDINLNLHLNYYIDDETDKSIKQYISDYLESCNDGNIFPISNLITKLENTFDIIKYIEFFDIDGITTQKIKSKFTSLLDMSKDELDSYVPEYINVKKKLDLSQKVYDYEIDSDGNYILDSKGEKVLVPNDDVNQTLTYPYNYSINLNYTYN